jgi:hypothetical protein
MAAGHDPSVARPAGVGVTDLPEEECVGSTFAMLGALQWLVALDAYLGELRGELAPEAAAAIRAALGRLPEIVDALARDRDLAAELGRLTGDLAASGRLVELLRRVEPRAVAMPDRLRAAASEAAGAALTALEEAAAALQRVEPGRVEFVRAGLRRLGVGDAERTADEEIQLAGVLGAAARPIGPGALDGWSCLALLKEVALELSDRGQARLLAEHFGGGVAPRRLPWLAGVDGYAAYEGIGALLAVDPVHPPKIAKAKKGWL